MAPIMLMLALTTHTAFAATTGCVNVTLPGISGLGTCLGTSLNLCTTPVSGIVTALTKVLQCLVTTLGNTSLLGLVAALLDFINFGLSFIGLSSLFSVVTGFVTAPLCAISGVPNCLTLLSGNQSCTNPVSLTLPSTLNVGKCLNQTLLLCQNGQPATDRLLLNLLNTLTCLLQSLLGTNPGSMINSSICLILLMLSAMFGTIPFFGPIFRAFLTIPAQTFGCGPIG
ncbi:uncharacterized protein LOC144158374 [Haemaphysalis longicornis]